MEAGDELTEGSVNPQYIKVKGINGVQAYLLHEVQRFIDFRVISTINIEVIVRQC